MRLHTLNYYINFQKKLKWLWCILQFTIFPARGANEQVPSSKAFIDALRQSVPFFHKMFDQRKYKAVKSSGGKKQPIGATGSLNYSCIFALKLLLRVVRAQRKPQKMQTKQQHRSRGLSQRKNAKLSKISDKCSAGSKIKVCGSLYQQEQNASNHFEQACVVQKKKRKKNDFSCLVHPCREK